LELPTQSGELQRRVPALAQLKSTTITRSGASSVSHAIAGWSAPTTIDPLAGLESIGDGAVRACPS
jgi:hypothetical protein